MDKSKKVSLAIVTLVFIVVVVVKMVSMLSEKQVLEYEIILEGPAVVKVGEFDENNYKMLVKYADSTESYKPFKKVYIRQEDLPKLDEVGKHTITFSYESTFGKFEIEIVG